MDFLGIGIGLPQLLLVLLVAMIVLGPERLPEVARQMARGVRTLRGYASDVQGQFGGELDEIREELLGIQRDLTDVQGNLRGGLLDLDQSLRAVQTEVQDAAGAAAALGAPESGTTPASPPEFRPPTPAGMRTALYRPAISEPAAGVGASDSDARLPDYRPPA